MSKNYVYYCIIITNITTMLKKNANIILIIFLFGSCNNLQKSDFSNNETIITGEKIDVGCMLYRPHDLIYFDPLLLFSDAYDDTLVTVFDTKNEQFVRRFILRGNGPGDAIPPLRLFVSNADKQIYALQSQTGGQIKIYEPDDIINKYNVIPKQIFLEKQPTYVRKVKNGYIGIGPLFDGGRFRLYDSAGNFVSEFGEYPFRGKEIEMSPMARYGVYQGYVAASADGNYFAIGTLYCDNLEFYSMEAGKAELIKKYETYDAKAIFHGNMMRVDDDCILNYRAAYGDKYCYMLYSGKPHVENGKPTRAGGNRIIVFDWNGNYLRSYKTEEVIVSFCVDEENNIIYAAVRDDNDESGGGFSIFKFNMK